MILLKGKEIYLRLLEENDAEALLQLEVKNREFFQKYAPLRADHFYTLEFQRHIIRDHLENYKLGNRYAFGIYLTSTNQLIGNIVLRHISPEPSSSGMIGYTLDQEHNGKGYMSEAIRLTVEFAFNELKLHRIEAGVMPHNLASMRILEKNGFHKEGLARKNVKINGRWEDHQILAILNPNDD
jgi:ribosomal-protein-alanine N-acetyltransferase